MSQYTDHDREQLEQWLDAYCNQDGTERVLTGKILDYIAATNERLRSPGGASGCGHVPAGYSCVTPGCSNGPAPEPEDLRAEVERLRVERYLCVLAMRCAMGAHHDGVDAMRERLEPVVARYGIATACAARAAISDADAACIEAQYSRSEIAGSSGEPVAKPNPCRNECSLISLDDDHWKCNHCDAVFAYTGAQKPVEKPRCWWPLCKETAGDALCDAVQSALTKGEKP